MSIQDIENKLAQYKKERKYTTAILSGLLLTSFALTLPILSDKTFVNRVKFCIQGLECSGENKHLVTEKAFNREKENSFFAESVDSMENVPSQDDTAIAKSFVASLLLFGAFGVSRIATTKMKRQIHTEYSSLKIEALKNNIVAKVAIDLEEFSKASQIELTKFAITQENANTINELKNPSQIEYEQIIGLQDGQIQQKLHELKLAELERELLKIELESKKLKDETNNPKKSTDATATTQDTPELTLQPEHVWYNRVLNEPCKVVTGVSGSGKSTFEHALIQLARQDKQFVIALYPNTTRTNKDENSKVISDPDAITNFLSTFNELVVNRKKHCKELGIDEDDYLDWLRKNASGEGGRIAIFAMEINNWESSGVDPFLIADFYRLCFTDIRKWGVTLTMTGQSINQGSVASELSSFSDLLKQQTKIQCLATTCPTTGKSISRGLAKVKFSDSDTAEEKQLLFYQPSEKGKY